MGLCVADLERSLGFYRDALGFREVRRLAIEGEAAATLLELADVALTAVFLERDGVVLELLHYARPAACVARVPRPMNAPGLTHLSLAVDDLAAAAEALERGGGRVLGATRTWNPALATGAIFALDPDGTRIELVQSRSLRVVE